MALKQILPKVFYTDIQIGLKFFVQGMGFTLGYHDDELYIVSRDEITFLLIQNEEYAKLDRPEIRIATDDIDGIYLEIQTRAPEILHPNSSVVTAKPWGLKEFATLDPTTVCIIFQQANN